MGNRKLKRVAKDVRFGYLDMFLRSPLSTRWKQYLHWKRTVSRRDVRKWLLREKWWILLMMCFITLFVLSWISIVGMAWNPWTAPLPALGLLGVLAVSEEVPGRWANFGATALDFLVSEAIYIPLALPRYLE
jgi:hypothetical protein